MRIVLLSLVIFAAVSLLAWDAKVAIEKRRSQIEFQQFLHIQTLVVLIEEHELDQNGAFPDSLPGLRRWARNKEAFRSVASNDAIWTYQSPFSGKSAAWCINPSQRNDVIIYAPFAEAEYDHKRLVGFSRTVSPFVKRLKFDPADEK